MSRAFGVESTVYRTMSFASASAWLTVLWMIGCLPVITAGASTVAMYAGARALAGGERHGYREFVRTAWEVRRRATVAAVLTIASWGLVVIAALASWETAFLTGAFLAMGMFLAAVSAVLPAAVLTARATGRSLAVTLGEFLMVRPGACLLSAVLWISAIATVLLSPIQFALVVALLAGPTCAAGTTLLLQRAPTRSRLRSASNTHPKATRGVSK